MREDRVHGIYIYILLNSSYTVYRTLVPTVNQSWLQYCITYAAPAPRVRGAPSD